MYIERHIEEILKETIKSFKVVLITGARQVGKSTMLKQIFSDSYNYVTLDDILNLSLAKDDPKLFFENNTLPLIIDEVQYAPILFTEIKRIVDRSEFYGQIILIGSQTFALMQGVVETLAGRVAILELNGLSFREINGFKYKEPFVPTSSYFNKLEEISKKDLWEVIHRGDMPELYKNEFINLDIFYGSYVKTYIERDVRNILNIKDLDIFSKFLVSLASRTGSLLNYHNIAKEVGKNEKTIKNWIKVLESSGIITLVRPFTNNAIKRVVETPVIYFLNTGLVSYLLRWTSKETLQNGAFSGQILETYVVSEIIKSFKNNGYINPPLSFYRDFDGQEIDLIIEKDGFLFPIEIKKTMNPKKDMAKNFQKLNKAFGFEVGNGVILSLLKEKVKLSDKLYAYPIYKI
ncbi:MAG: ATP-binding protein [Bacilli bacterium]|jgi:predicted AAA+ superfamily ATPase|nr:ATP-binding protein [Bacilli bacterium]